MGCCRGGGGSSYGSTGGYYEGGPGQATPNGQCATRMGGNGGINGAGGSDAPSSSGGGGGGGWSSDGSVQQRSNWVGRGRGNGFRGGECCSSVGGFGGGAGSDHQGGGGGGYSGGGGGHHAHSGGGGGGSWHSGIESGWTEGGNDANHGSIEFTYLEELGSDVAKWRLSPCGRSGRYGPTRTDCAFAYKQSGMPEGTLRSVDSGVQQIRIPVAGLYRVIAAGARGGRGSYVDRYGGSGAIAAGIFNFSEGETIMVAVGQNGDTRDGRDTHESAGGAGGGGTFVYREDDDEPLIVAGGGGGVSYASSDYSGRPGRADPSGGNAYPNGGSGGSNGQGGGVGGSGDTNAGGGGAGWRARGSCPSTPATCGQGLEGNWVGGQGRYNSGCCSFHGELLSLLTSHLYLSTHSQRHVHRRDSNCTSTRRRIWRRRWRRPVRRRRRRWIQWRRRRPARTRCWRRWRILCSGLVWRDLLWRQQ